MLSRSGASILHLAGRISSGTTEQLLPCAAAGLRGIMSNPNPTQTQGGDRSSSASFLILGSTFFGSAALLTQSLADAPSSPAPSSTLSAASDTLSASKATSRKPEAIQLGGAFNVPPPPYPLDALEPHMSLRTLETHWGKHHRTYCENLNKQVAGTELETKSLKEVVLAAWSGGKTLPCFNNAAQVWNHTFFWDSMKPGGGGSPDAGGKLAAAIDRDFGSLDGLRKELQTAGLTQFGSGWAWLVADDEGKLKVLKTTNAVSPLVTGWTPLLTIDVWEHAYYLDHQNRRADYITLFLDHLVDWGTVEERYKAVGA